MTSATRRGPRRETLFRRRLPAEMRRQEFQRDITSQPVVVRLVDDSHPARVDQLQDQYADAPPSIRRPASEPRLPPARSRAPVDRRARDARARRAVIRLRGAGRDRHRIDSGAIALDRRRHTRSPPRRRPERAASDRSTSDRDGRACQSCLQLPIQPGARDRPFPFDRRRRDVQGVGRLFDAHPAVEAALDDFGLTFAHSLQPREGLVELDQFVSALVRNGQCVAVVERENTWPPPVFRRRAPRSRSGCGASPAPRLRNAPVLPLDAIELVELDQAL